MWMFLLTAAVSTPWLGNVDWSDIQTTDGCFFFSGPLDIGRDDHLGSTAIVRTGHQREVSFGDNRFVGPATGDAVLRSSVHSFNGEWEVRERLQGSWTGRSFAGTYRYEEQPESDAHAGRCVITANVRIRPE